MRQFGKWPGRHWPGVILSLSATLLAVDTMANPYLMVVGRNVFALRPEQRQDPPLVSAPLPTVTPTGITTILQAKCVLLKVRYPSRPPEPVKETSCILTVGQREGPIEVLAIDEIAGSVKVNNSGTEMVLTLDRDSPKAPPSPVPPNPPPRQNSPRLTPPGELAPMPPNPPPRPNE